MNSMRVFQIADSGPIEIVASREPFEDLVRRFPPCRALNADPALCSEITKHQDDLNFSAVTWKAEHTLVVMGEVPSSGHYGGIVGQVMGYEVEIPSGKIERTMNAKEFKARWQHSMAWKFHVPEAPESAQ